MMTTVTLTLWQAQPLSIDRVGDTSSLIGQILERAGGKIPVSIPENIKIIRNNTGICFMEDDEHYQLLMKNAEYLYS